MNSGATSGRVYDGLKRRILEREFRPGDRLDPTALSETLNSSVTPVRDALHSMKGEGLIETRLSEGFYLPHVDAPGLQDLYAWTADVLGLALKHWQPRSTDGDGTPPVREIVAAETAPANAALFARIAGQSSNLEHRRAIASANDRLHAARLAESKVMTGIQEELAAITAALAGGLKGDLRGLLSAYHRRRHRAAAEIIRTLYRNGTPR